MQKDFGESVSNKDIKLKKKLDKIKLKDNEIERWKGFLSKKQVANYASKIMNKMFFFIQDLPILQLH